MMPDRTLNFLHLHRFCPYLFVLPPLFLWTQKVQRPAANNFCNFVLFCSCWRCDRLVLSCFCQVLFCCLGHAGGFLNHKPTPAPSTLIPNLSMRPRPKDEHQMYRSDLSTWKRNVTYVPAVTMKVGDLDKNMESKKVVKPKFTTDLSGSNDSGRS